MVVSHDCEFNPGKRVRFLAARIESLPAGVAADAAKFAELKAGNDYRARSADGNPIAHDAFYLEPIPALDEYPLGAVAVFTSITPLPLKFKADLLRLMGNQWLVKRQPSPA
jgi:hypothetical protein